MPPDHPGKNDPTSLLWAYQLKRQHAVLQRQMMEMKEVIATDHELEGVNGSDMLHRLERLEQVNVPSMVHQLDRLEQDLQAQSKNANDDAEMGRQELAKSERVRTELTKQNKALLKRLEQVEKGLECHRGRLQDLDRQSNEPQLNMIVAELNWLKRQQHPRKDNFQVSLAALTGDDELPNQKLTEALRQSKAGKTVAERLKDAEKRMARKPALNRIAGARRTDDENELAAPAHRERTEDNVCPPPLPGCSTSTSDQLPRNRRKPQANKQEKEIADLEQAENTETSLKNPEPYPGFPSRQRVTRRQFMKRLEVAKTIPQPEPSITTVKHAEALPPARKVPEPPPSALSADRPRVISTSPEPGRKAAAGRRRVIEQDGMDMVEFDGR